MIVVKLTYPDNLDLIDKLLDEHVNWLDHLYKESILLASGRRNPRSGRVLIFRNPLNQNEVNDLLKNDPFQQAGAIYEIIDFNPTKSSSDSPLI